MGHPCFSIPFVDCELVYLFAQMFTVAHTNRLVGKSFSLEWVSSSPCLQIREMWDIVIYKQFNEKYYCSFPRFHNLPTPLKVKPSHYIAFYICVVHRSSSHQHGPTKKVHT